MMNQDFDVEIIAEDGVVKAHRSVLSASSPYFEAMFSSNFVEKEKDKIEIHYVDADILRIIVEYLYTGRLQLNQDNVLNLIVAGDMLGQKDVVDECTFHLIRHTHVTNAVGLFLFAEQHHLHKLAEFIRKFIEENFQAIANEEEFCGLEKAHFIRFLKSEFLRVDGEYQVLLAVIKWISSDISERKCHLDDLLRYTRIPLIPTKILRDCIEEMPQSPLKFALKCMRVDMHIKKEKRFPLFSQPRLGAIKGIYLIGGKKIDINSSWSSFDINHHMTIDHFDSSTDKWTSDLKMDKFRSLPGVASVNGQIYIVGGSYEPMSYLNGPAEYHADGVAYDRFSNTWFKIASMSEPRCNFGLCAIDGYLYAIGGSAYGKPTASIERYDIEKDKWSVIGQLPEPRYGMRIAAYEGKVYIVGGTTPGGNLDNEFIKFDPTTGLFTSLPPMLDQRTAMGVTILNGYLYAVGGSHNEAPLDRVERYSFKDNEWSRVASMRKPRWFPAVAACGGCIYAMGTQLRLDVNFYLTLPVSSSSVERYNPQRNVWEESASLPESRTQAVAIAL